MHEFWTPVCTTSTGLTLLEMCGGSVDEFEGDEFETALLEAIDDVSNETSLDTVGLRWDQMTETVLVVSRSVSASG